MEKRTENGTTLYFDAEENIVDIDVEKGKETAYLFTQSISLRYCVEVDLDKISKQFPDVKTLVIGPKICDIRISNKMFPNVRLVLTDDNIYFNSNVPYLSHDVTLMNTFCLREDEALDLGKIQRIASKAFDGCMSRNIINIENIDFAYNGAFDGFYLIDENKDKPTIMLGNMLIYVNKNIKELEIPANTQVIACDVDFINIEKIIIHDVIILRQLHLIESSNIEEIVLDFENAIDGDIDSINFYSKHISINKNNPYYKVVDDMLYTRDCTKLIKAPICKDGVISIKEGTKHIGKYAFCYSNMQELIMPDSLISIGPAAFQYCKQLTKIHFGKSIRCIEYNAFSDCRNLKKLDLSNVDIPSLARYTFSGCTGLQEVVFPNNLITIGSQPFGWGNMQSINIPASVQSVDNNAFGNNITDVTLNSMLFPDNIVESVTSDTTESKQFIRFHMPDGSDFVVPRYIGRKNARELDRYLVINGPDNVIQKKIIDYAINVDMKQKCALVAYKQTQDDDIKAYIKRISANLAAKLLDSEEEDLFLYLLSLDVLSKKALQNLAKKAADINNTVISAYLLEKIGKRYKKNSFVL